MSDPLIFTVGKADPTGKEPTPGAVLNITGKLTEVRQAFQETGEAIPWRLFRARCLNIHVEEAQQVCAALAHLPQGTIDQVLRLLLEQRASLLRVPGNWPIPADSWPEPPAAFRAMVRMLIGRFNLAGPEYPDATEATAVLWESLRPREAEEESA